jgi:hypothetical protein
VLFLHTNGVCFPVFRIHSGATTTFMSFPFCCTYGLTVTKVCTGSVPADAACLQVKSGRCPTCCTFWVQFRIRFLIGNIHSCNVMLHGILHPFLSLWVQPCASCFFLSTDNCLWFCASPGGLTSPFKGLRTLSSPCCAVGEPCTLILLLLAF